MAAQRATLAALAPGSARSRAFRLDTGERTAARAGVDDDVGALRKYLALSAFAVTAAATAAGPGDARSWTRHRALPSGGTIPANVRFLVSPRRDSGDELSILVEGAGQSSESAGESVPRTSYVEVPRTPFDRDPLGAAAADSR